METAPRLEKIAIVGAGGLGREVAMLIQQINLRQKQWDFVGYFDAIKEKGSTVNNAPVLGGNDELNAWSERLNIVLALGDPKVKQKVHGAISNPNIIYPTLIHPNVSIGDFVTIGDGSIITAGNILTVNITIGKHVILNLGCTVGHDTIIGDCSSFMPGVNISGEVTIGTGVYVGTGAKIINRLEIGENCIIGAGAVVSKTLPGNCTAVGVPAKPIKFH